MFVEAQTADFPTSGAKLIAEQAQMTSTATGLSAAFSPIPAALDEVSGFASGVFTVHGTIFAETRVNFLTKFAQSAAVLPIIGAEYLAADTANAGSISAAQVNLP